MENEKLFTLLIIFRERDSITINDVENYGTLTADRLFYYKKNGFRVFIPMDAVTLFGRADIVYDQKGN